MTYVRTSTAANFAPAAFTPIAFAPDGLAPGGFGHAEAGFSPTAGFPAALPTAKPEPSPRPVAAPPAAAPLPAAETGLRPPAYETLEVDLDTERRLFRCRVRLDEGDLARLDGSSPLAPHLPSFREVMRAEHLSRDKVWDHVRRGEYRAFRARRGQCWEWRLQRSPAPDVGRDSEETDQNE